MPMGGGVVNVKRAIGKDREVIEPVLKLKSASIMGLTRLTKNVKSNSTPVARLGSMPGNPAIFRPCCDA